MANVCKFICLFCDHMPCAMPELFCFAVTACDFTQVYLEMAIKVIYSPCMSTVCDRRVLYLLIAEHPVVYS